MVAVAALHVFIAERTDDLAGLVAAAGDDDACALAGVGQRGRAADAGEGAGDEDDLVDAAAVDIDMRLDRDEGFGVGWLAELVEMLRVRGVDGLRVADGSIMPDLITVNPCITTMMIGERCADFITNPR